MRVTELTTERYADWDRFCLTSRDAWFWQTTDWLAYNLAYKPELKPQHVSFMIVDDADDIFAICPLLIETYDDGAKEFSFGGLHTPIPAYRNDLSAKILKEVMELTFATIDELARTHGVSRAKLRFVVLNESFLKSPYPPSNYLMKFGYLNNSINTQVIDLRQTLDTLFSQVRHGHKSDIKKASSLLTVTIFDRDTITADIFERYIALHAQAAGRVTRPRATFDIMLKILRDGHAFLVGAMREGVYVGFSYFVLYKEGVYWGSSAVDPAHDGIIPIEHFIQWSAITWMHQRGCQFYEVGWQRYTNILSSDFLSSKELSISKFKRGFGGFTTSLFRGERFYNREYFMKIYGGRMRGYYDWMQ